MTDSVQHHRTRAWYLRPPVWLLGVVVVALIIFAVVEAVGITPATPYGTFLDQLDVGNVASVTLQGTEIKGRFKNPLNAVASDGKTPTVAFHSRLPDFGDTTLIAALRKQHVSIDVTSSSSWMRLLAGVPLPMLLLLGFIVIAGIVRFMRGGKAQSGSTTSGATAMPMHPMQGMIGLVSGLFGKQSQAASTPKPGSEGRKSV